MAGELLVAVVGAAGIAAGALITSVIGSRSSESTQLRKEAAELRSEIIELRKVFDRRHTHLSLYARSFEIVCLAWRLSSLKEQIETIRMAKEALERALGSGGGDGGGK